MVGGVELALEHGLVVVCFDSAGFFFITPTTAQQDSFIKTEDYGSKQCNIQYKAQRLFAVDLNVDVRKKCYSTVGTFSPNIADLVRKRFFNLGSNIFCNRAFNSTYTKVFDFTNFLTFEII